MLLSTLVLCSARCLFVILRRRRVRARPASDSDPVRRHGPERGSTGGGGRPRSFPSGPLLREAKRRAGRAEDGRAGKAGTASMVGVASDALAARRCALGSKRRGLVEKRIGFGDQGERAEFHEDVAGLVEWSVGVHRKV